MALRYLLDEHLRGPLWWALQRHNAKSADHVDAVRVADAGGPQFAAADREILVWAEQTGRILITLDEKTMPGHLEDHLRDGHHSPGVFMVRPAANLPELVEFLVLAMLLSEPTEFADRVAYVP